MAKKRGYNIGDEVVVTNLERNELYGLIGKVMYVGIGNWGMDVYFESLHKQHPLLNEDVAPVPVKIPTVWAVINNWGTLISIHNSREGAKQKIEGLKLKQYYGIVEKEIEL